MHWLLLAAHNILTGSLFLGCKLITLLDRQQKYEIKQFLQDRNVDKSIQTKVMKFMEQMHYKNMQKNIYENAFNTLQSFSKNLVDEVYLNFYGRIVLQIPQLRETFSEKFLKALALQMREVSYNPGEVVYEKGTQDTPLLYLYKGKLQEFAQERRDNMPDAVFDLGTISSGSLINLREFLTSDSKPLSIRALELSSFITITFQEFLRVLINYPDDYEKFCKLRDLNAQNIVVSNNPCASCQKTTHTILSCPYIQYIPQKMFLISKYNFSQTQDRGKKTRARKQHYNTYQNAKTQRIQLRHLREKLVSEIIMNDEEAYQELVELFHLNYQENSDQEFILNTPGIIKNDKEEYVIKEDDSFLEEEYYLDYLKEQEKNLFSLPDQMQSGNVESNLLQEIDEVTDPVKEKEHAKITSLEQALLVQEEDIKSKNESHMSVQINVSNENCDLSSKKEDKVLLKQGSNCSVSKQGGDQQQQPQP